jgi:heme iron utilization protein
MSSSSIGKHAGTGATTSQAPIPEPSFAERARTLVHLNRIGSLSTLSRKQAGFPFGSVMPYGLDKDGRPTFLISTMAMHTQNLKADARASLLVTQPEASGDPLAASRVTVMGMVLPVPEAEVAEARALYLERYPNSKHWVDFEDFFFFRMNVVDVYYVGGFGVMGWIASSDYEQARQDPLADVAAAILEHMNRDHKDALLLFARSYAGIAAEEAAAEETTMTSVDRLGFHLRLKSKDGMRSIRIPFSREVSDAAETRQVLIEMVEQARLR